MLKLLSEISYITLTILVSQPFLLWQFLISQPAFLWKSVKLRNSIQFFLFHHLFLSHTTLKICNLFYHIFLRKSMQNLIIVQKNSQKLFFIKKFKKCIDKFYLWIYHKNCKKNICSMYLAGYINYIFKKGHKNYGKLIQGLY